MSTSPRMMGPRERVRGLMRGDRARFQTGYTAENAVIAVCEIHGVPEEDREALLQYADGFSDGLHRVEALEPFAPQPMQEGYLAGLRETGCQPG